MREVDIEQFAADLEDFHTNPTKGEIQARKAERATTDIIVKEVNDFRYYLVNVRKYLLAKGPKLELYVSMLAYEQRMGLLNELMEAGTIPTYPTVRKSMISALSILGYLIPLVQKALSMKSKSKSIKLIREFFQKKLVIKPDYIWSSEEQEFIPSVVESKGKIRKLAIEPIYMEEGAPYLTRGGKIATSKRPFYESESELMGLLDTLKDWSEGMRPFPKEETWGKK